MDSLKQLYSNLFQHSLKRTVYVIAGLIIALSLPITILLTQQQQDLRQRATFNNGINENNDYVGGEGGNSYNTGSNYNGASCYGSTGKNIGCSCTSNSQCVSNYCAVGLNSQRQCQTKPTSPTPTPTQLANGTPAPSYSPNSGGGIYANCSAATGRGTYCTCSTSNQCASNNCMSYAQFKICGPGNGTGTPTSTPTPTATVTCGVNNRTAGCACQLSTQCQSGLTCFNNICSGGGTPLTPTPTNGPNETRIMFTIGLPGISNTTGATLPPKRIGRETKIEVYNSANQKVSEKTGTLVYDTASKLYKGTVSLGDGFTTGQYVVKIKMDNTLWKRIPGIVTITEKTDTNPTTQVQLVTGDLDQNNSLTVVDYTNFVKCFKGDSTCTDSLKILADLDDDGSAKDDLDDLTILQKGFAVRDGD